MLKTHLALCFTFAVVLATSLVGCRSGSIKARPAAVSEETSDLTWVEARERRARLENVRYEVRVQLNERDLDFKGQSLVSFDLSDSSKPLRIDFFEGQVTSLKVNGQSIELTAKKKFWLELPAEALKKGFNQVSIDYVQNYSTQGQGLHRFQDAETKQVFLYSQFETYDANRFMPCFDQPDLRAALTLTVLAPSSWQVITTMQESSTAAASPGMKLWKFPATPQISTYLYSLHAGPYTVWKDRYEDIPLRIFARPSLAKYVRHSEWFKITKQGLKFFNQYFAYKYPFKKYDQLFVPEFNAGAMENVAAVTFNEGMLSRSQLTRDQKRRQYNTLLHEMAHMWFGDIVTMKWWNDLWLNESFATYMANLALYEATEFKEVWQTFFASSKGWAYWEDSLATTHPIEAPVPSVKVAFANFDGITYGKGAAVMKQLRAYVGAKNFDLGIQNYIASHAFKNAELKDLIVALQGQTKADLSDWSERWLKQSGTDKIAASWSCDGDQLKQIELKTSNKNNAKFRPQTMQVGLFKAHDGGLTSTQSIRVTVTQDKQIVKGPWPCPDFVYPNHGDDAYVKVSLDPVSLAYTKKHLSRVQDPLLRTMLWNDVWNMVRETELPLNEYVQILKHHFPPEADEIILAEIVDTIFARGGEDSTVLQYWPQTTEQNKKDRQAFIAEIERQYLQRFNQAQAGSDGQKFWFDQYVNVARSPASLIQIEKWARSAQVAKGFPLDVDRRWNLVFQLARYSHPSAARLAEDLKKKDASNRGKNSLLSIEAVKPDLAIKRKNIEMLKMPKLPLSLAEARAVLGSLFPPEQLEYQRQFSADIYEYLKLNGNNDGEERLVNTVAWTLSPLSCEPGDSSVMKKFIAEQKDMAPSLAKALKVNLEEDERCQRIRMRSGF